MAGPLLSRALPSRVLGSHAAETQVTSSFHELAALTKVNAIVPKEYIAFTATLSALKPRLCSTCTS